MSLLTFSVVDLILLLLYFRSNSWLDYTLEFFFDKVENGLKRLNHQNFETLLFVGNGCGRQPLLENSLIRLTVFTCFMKEHEPIFAS